MKKRIGFLTASVVVALLPLLWFVSVQARSAQSRTGPPVLRVNLEAEPATLDPALASDPTSFKVIEQLFVALVDIADDTEEVVPELATGWDISANGLVYTFTLRNDATWSDGAPLTAADVRYGILRSLDPATGAGFQASLLAGIIENGNEFWNGDITDPNLVGVAALDTTHLRITMDQPAAHALSILARPVARPMPQGAIDAHGVPTWTEAANIVTSGPYLLSEWVHGDHITLEKNPAYFDAGNVQITEVQAAMVDVETGWQMYLNGDLDTATVPDDATLDAITAQEVRLVPDGGVSYDGFSVSQPPFDDPLVRKAFVAAIDRQRFIDEQLGGFAFPAQTLTPPGIFGHVDGIAEGIGIAHDPAQAQQWLADAGYPGGDGLPPVTYTYPESELRQTLAEYHQADWYATLGVSVTLQSLPFFDFLAQCTGACQMWSLGWRPDYNDALDYLDLLVYSNQERLGGWSNATYDNLLAQAKTDPDPATRVDLYRQAEEILVESDAVMAPQYYGAQRVATKPYLKRTFPVPVSPADIADWRLTWVTKGVDTNGGSLTSFDGDTVITIPSGAFADDVLLAYTPASGTPPGGDLVVGGPVFDLSAVYSDTEEPAPLAAGATFSLTIHYDEDDLGSYVVEETLALYYWDGEQWIPEPSSVLDPAADTIMATPDHLSLWALLAEDHHLLLPIILNGDE